VATLTIRELDEDLRAGLRVRAARHGRSMEAEVREILRAALAKPLADDRLGSRLRQRFGPIGAAPLELPPRTGRPRAADLS